MIKRVEGGFSLLELSVVLVVMGSVLSIATFSYGYVLRKVDQAKTARSMDEVQNALLTFVITNHRLPCADTDGNGYEGTGLPASCLSAQSDKAGGLPFKTLFLDSEPFDAAHHKFRYGVYRNSASSADLATNTERTGDAATTERFQNLDDFIQALRNAQGVTPLLATQVFVTGDGVSSGAIQCATNIVANVAYVLISGGDDDLDGLNGYLDGANGAFGGAVTCSESPFRVSSGLYDDQVIVESFVGLTGKLLKLPKRL